MAMGIIYYDIAAILVVSLTLLFFYGKRHLFTSSSRFFGMLLTLSLASAIFDILSVITDWNAQAYSLPTLYAINMAYYFFHTAQPIVYCLFLFAIIGKLPRLKRHNLFLLSLPWLAIVAIIAFTPLSDWAFYFDASNRYVRGPALILVYIMAFFYASIGLGTLFRYRHSISRDIRFTVFLFAPFSIIPVVLQYFWPELLIQNFGLAITELIVLLTMQDSGRFIDQTSGFFNRDGLAAQFDELLQKQRGLLIFLVALENTEFLRHALGSESLSALDWEVGRRLFGYPRPGRFAAQLGVGNFALVLVDATADRAAAEQENLLGNLKDKWIIRGRPIIVSARVCAIRIPDDTKDFQRILQAQRRLNALRWPYPNKEILGLNDLALGDSGRTAELTQAIRRALIADGLKIQIQPIVNAERKIVSGEILLRLNDERLGRVPPDEFIPIAERNDSIYRLGDFVFESAFSLMRLLRDETLAIDHLAINLSPVQCLRHDFVGSLLSAIARFGLKPSDFQLEITETAAYSSPSVMKRNVEALRAAGFVIAVDDFGSGHSNIANLIELPFDIIKLDRGLIMTMTDCKRGLLTAETLAFMFSNMSVAMIAEGVETEEQFALLKAKGVTLFQGFLFSKPLDPSAFIQKFKTGTALC